MLIADCVLSVGDIIMIPQGMEHCVAIIISKDSSRWLVYLRCVVLMPDGVLKDTLISVCDAITPRITHVR